MTLHRYTVTYYHLVCDNCHKQGKHESVERDAYDMYLDGWICSPSNPLAFCSPRCQAEYERKRAARSAELDWDSPGQEPILDGAGNLIE